MPTPSLLIVPSRWKTGNPGKLYSQIPTNGNGDFSVTGVVTGAGNIGTRVNDLGYIETITTSGTPRLDYYTSSGTPGCPALLVEPSAQNLAINSQTWDAGNNWQLAEGSGRVTVATATSGTLAPDGLSTANAISPTSANITHYLYSNASGTISYVSGTVYTLSAFFKKGAGDSGRYVQIAGRGGGRFVGDPYANFDLELGTALTVSGSVADSNRVSRIQNYGNGWYRCSLTATCTATAASTVGVLAALLTADTNARLGAAFAGNTSDYIFGWGAQLETGSVATSYIPTTTGSVTRAADIISVSGAVSGSIGQTEGTIYAEVDVRQLVGSVAKTFIDIGVSSNRIFLGFTSIASNTIRLQIDSIEGLTTVDIRAAVSSSGIIKIAAAYKSSNCALYVNGASGTVTSNSTFTLSTLSNISLGKTLSDTAFLNDRIRAAALYTTRLSNADLMLLTMPGNNTYLPQAVWNNYLSRTGNTELPDCLYTRHADLLDV